MPASERWQRRPVSTGLTTGAALFGVVGLIVGLVRGLTVYVPTAWAATLEVGMPSALLGVLVGAMVGLTALIFRGRA